jgi:hypothetical protein
MAGTTIPSVQTPLKEHGSTGLIYINMVNKFEDNNTFYVDLNFSDTYDSGEEEALILTSEEDVFSNGDVTRKLIPERTRSLFQFEGLSTITIYNKDNVKLTTGKYSHIEYIQDWIDNKFVAVYEVENPDIKDFVFCVGDQKKDLMPIKYTEFEDEALNKSIATHVRNAGTVAIAKHYKLDQAIYSAISIDTAAYIIETTGKNHKTLYTSEFIHAFKGLTFTSKTINNKPVILAAFSRSNTDVTWTRLMTFNGKKYQQAKNHLIKE